LAYVANLNFHNALLYQIYILFYFFILSWSWGLEVAFLGLANAMMKKLEVLVWPAYSEWSWFVPSEVCLFSVGDRGVSRGVWAEVYQ